MGGGCGGRETTQDHSPHGRSPWDLLLPTQSSALAWPVLRTAIRTSLARTKSRARLPRAQRVKRTGERAPARPAQAPSSAPAAPRRTPYVEGRQGWRRPNLGQGSGTQPSPHPVLPVRTQSVVTANSEAAHGVSPVGSGRTRAPASAPAPPLQSEGSRELGDTLFVSRTRHSSSRNSKFNMNTPQGNTQNCLISISKENNYIRKSHPH